MPHDAFAQLLHQVGALLLREHSRIGEHPQHKPWPAWNIAREAGQACRRCRLVLIRWNGTMAVSVMFFLSSHSARMVLWNTLHNQAARRGPSAPCHQVCTANSS